ncbi:MAG: hypothetical protein HY675_11325 [Chloroflexi bacterium]|nr:hypothetical protein [Chloroflexota bacterium]
MTRTPAQKHEVLEEVIRELERRFGPGVVYRVSQARPKVGEIAVATGSLGLDRATGIGGVPRGRITEILGAESSGKTTLTCHIIANAQKGHGLAVLVDAEHSADTEAMARCGANLSDLILAVPGTVEEALEMTDILIRCGALDALVFSSSSALFCLPRSGRSVHYLLSRALRNINVSLKGSPTALVFVGPSSFHASMRIELLPVRPIFQPGGDIGGIRVRARLSKNRFATPSAVAEFDILEEKGIHREAELFDLGCAIGAIEKMPLGFVFGREFLGRGRERAIIALEKDRGLAEKLERVLGEL